VTPAGLVPPHIETDEQIELGLQGTLLVRGANEPAIARERTFVLDDVDLDEGGDVVIEPSREDLVHGRRGDTLLVNGKLPGFVIASPNSVERWRLVNTSNGRFFKLRGGVPLRVIGWDGGLIPNPYDDEGSCSVPASVTTSSWARRSRRAPPRDGGLVQSRCCRRCSGLVLRVDSSGRA
jgi:blue copper oxidase